MFSSSIYLKRRAHCLCAGLIDRLREIEAFDFPSKAPKDFLQLMLRILSETDKVISQTDDVRSLNMLCESILFHASLLEFLDQANTSQTPRCLTNILEYFLHPLYPKARVLVYPQPVHNYSIFDALPLLQGMTENIFSPAVQKAVYTGYSELFVVTFPRIERDNVLVHAAFGHEVGHPVASEFLLREETQPAYSQACQRYTGEIEKVFKKEIEARGSDFEKLQFKASRFEELLEIRKRGLQELMSDAVGVLLLGPSAIFATYDIMGSGSLNDVPTKESYYPPTRYRMRFQYSLLERFGYLSSFNLCLEKADASIATNLRSWDKQIQESIADETDKQELDNIKLIRLSYQWLEETIEEALAFCREKIQLLLYQPSLIETEVPELMKRLKLGIPANEIGVYPNCSTPDWRSSVLASWITCIGSELVREGAPSKELTAEIRHLQILTLRSVEYVLLQVNYSNNVSSQNGSSQR